MLFLDLSVNRKFGAKKMQNEKVCVTGANGFLASHIVAQLLEEGCTVHATVRSVRDSAKTAFLASLAQKHGAHRLVLFSGDLVKDGSFDEAFRGCSTIVHVATPVVMTSPNPQRDIVDPAVQGVHNVVRSVQKNAATIRKFIFTSTLETVKRVANQVCREDVWNDTASIDYAYCLAKVLAERAVVESFETVAELKPIRLVRLLPGWIAGPLLNCPPVPVSLEVFLALGSGEYYPLCPNFFVQIVDVRDCAAAHVAAVKTEFKDSSSRIAIASEAVLSMSEIAQLSKKCFPALPFGSVQMPDAFIWLASLWDERVSRGFLRENLGKKYAVSNATSLRVLGVRYRSAEETVRDSVASLIGHGALVTKYNKVALSILLAVIAIIALIFMFY